VRAKLGARHADVWVASAAAAGTAHLVPLSWAWDGAQAILAVEPSSATARNIALSGRARLALGDTRDVVMIDAALESVVDVAQAPSCLGNAYAGQADWDPRAGGGPFVFVCLQPTRIQAWRNSNEIEGRTVMRNGAWIY
jgi:hypothetical protein